MDIYLSKCINYLHKKEMIQQLLHDKVCLTPVYNSVKLRQPVDILMDSGAFTHHKKDIRLSFEQAYSNQLNFEQKLGYKSKYIIPYDKLDDIHETINAHQWMIDNVVNRNIVGVVQGNTIDEKINCYNEIVNMGFNYIGFGGIAKIGVNKKKRNILYETLRCIEPINKIHFFGVGNIEVLYECREILGNDVYLSCDTSVIEMASVMGRVFLEGKWKKIYTNEDRKLGMYHAKDLYDTNVKNILPYYEAI